MSDELNPGRLRPANARDTSQRDTPPNTTSSEVQALRERAEQLGATAEELEAALDALALQAEVVLHRLRGGSVH